MTPTTQTTIGPNLHNKCVLIRLHIRLWEGVVQDRQAQKQMAETFGLTNLRDAVAKKRLMGDALNDIKRQAGVVRVMWQGHTLPWEDDGVRIATSVAAWKLLPHLGAEVEKLKEMVAGFVEQYPQLLAERKWALGGLWHEDEYPKPEEVANLFAVRIGVRPLPDSQDFRTSMSDDERAYVEGEMRASFEEALKRAQADTWGRLKDGLGRMRERLTAYRGPGTGRTGSFKDSLVENLKEIVDRLPELNLADDPTLKAVCEDIGRRCIVDPGLLREDPTKRLEVRDAADELLDRIGGLGW